ncbi:MAG: patatin family protein [Anaerotruncus sp.]|nr:patatin family protein [Anaerotruncus sp.]
MKTGLVLEGGGMRGLYTQGVLDCMIDAGFWADYVIGVSAGACAGVSYVSRQRGRSYRVSTTYGLDKRYLSLHSYFKTRSLFGMDFMFEEIPNRLDPFDYQTFAENPIEFVLAVTDVLTGKPVYFGKEHLNHDSTVLRASSSIPLFSPPVEYQGGLYLDGGIADPIPVRRALDDGCERLIVVLTRDRSYQKSPQGGRMVYRHAFRHYPQMIHALEQRHQLYNTTLQTIRELEREGVAVVIAPAEPVKISRFEQNMGKLRGLYKTGMLDAQKFLAKARPLKK